MQIIWFFRRAGWCRESTDHNLEQKRSRFQAVPDNCYFSSVYIAYNRQWVRASFHGMWWCWPRGWQICIGRQCTTSTSTFVLHVTHKIHNLVNHDWWSPMHLSEHLLQRYARLCGASSGRQPYTSVWIIVLVSWRKMLVWMIVHPLKGQQKFFLKKDFYFFSMSTRSVGGLPPVEWELFSSSDSINKILVQLKYCSTSRHSIHIFAMMPISRQSKQSHNTFTVHMYRT